MGASNGSYIMTLVNSIIGVSILAMPFCYKQCGILLATLILVFSNLMTRLSCHYLVKSAIMTRRRSYELLAFHALGGSGKTAVELSIILLMVGTCIAFFVVMGDLGPAIIGHILQVEYSATLRPAVLIGLAVFVVLPLGLLRNVDSLSSICTASFLFYLLLVMKVFIESMDNLFSSPWTDEVHFWRPAGLLQCLPIFSMALSCQTQLLEIFDSIQNGTLDKMNSIVKSAVNLCTALYMSVGFLGYIAYYKTSFTGNLLMSFSASHFSEFIKLGFVLSLAVSFPLVIFPCRTSLHSFLFKKVHTPHYELVTGGGNHIPGAQFKCITFFIITSSLIVGLLAPNIEIVLGLLGSTIGVVICILCPPFIFMWISNKATTEKVLARGMCIFGLFIMVMGTYANIYLGDSPVVEERAQNFLEVPVDMPAKPLEEKKIADTVEKIDVKAPPNANVPKSREQKLPIESIAAAGAKKELEKEEDKRIEPPIPQDPEVRPPPAEQKEAKKLDQKDEKDKLEVKSGKDAVPQVNEKQNVPQERKKIAKKNYTTLVKPNEKVRLEKVEKKPQERKSNAVAVELNEVQKLAKEQPPLPLLMKAQSDLETKNRVDDQNNDGLDKPKIVEREKRDLDYVTNLTKIDRAKASEKVGVNSDSFVQKVAENKSADQVCKKEKKKENESVQSSTKLKVGVPTQKLVDSLVKQEDKRKDTPTIEKQNENNIVQHDTISSTSLPKRATVRKTKEEKTGEQKQNMIMSPSKLTDPDLIIQDNLHVDEKQPMVIKIGNSISRELKAIEKEVIQRKK